MLILKCINKQLESAAVEKDSGRKGKFKDGLVNLVSNMSSSKGLKNPTRSDRKDSSKQKDQKNDGFFKLFQQEVSSKTNNPFTKFSLSKHVDKKLMTAIQKAYLERPSEIRSFWVRNNRT